MPADHAEVPSTEPPPTARARPSARVGEAESRALGQLFREHAPFLVRVVTRMVGSVARAEDVVQRAFLTAHRKGLPDGGPDAARAWLYRVAMNELRHERRSIARRIRLAGAVSREPASPASTPDADLDARSTVTEVRRVVAQLPEAQREVFVLYELEEMSGAEIAALLALPENTVWSRLRLARGRFRKLWAARDEEGEA